MIFLRWVLCWFLVLCAPLVWAGGFSSGELAHSLKGKVVFLRGMQSGDDLSFDASGAEIGTDTPGAFSYSALKVEKVRLSDTKLNIEAKRVALIFQTASESPSLEDIRFVPLKESIDVVIAVDAQHPGALDAAVKKVFALSPNEVLSAMSPAAETVALDSLGSAAPVHDVVWIRSVSGSKQVIYHVKPGEASAPTLIYSVPPVFPDDAKKKRIQGFCVLSVIVDTAGHPEHIRITRSADPGLDVSAVITVAQWRFTPAMYQGKDVPVMINVMVNFRIL